MKVVSSKEMGRIESLAYDKGAKESEFMEAAGHGIASFVQNFVRDNDLAKVVTLLCGKGNNGGDAYVAGRLLHQMGFAVTSYQLGAVDECSPLCQKNYYRFIGEGGFAKEIHSAADCRFPTTGVIVDALFGTGFHGAASGLFASCIEAANGTELPIVSVDIPSGLNGITGDVEGAAIHADVTLFLGCPKTGFFLKEGWNYVGHLQGVDFGLDEEFVDKGHEDFEWLTPDLLQPLMPKIRRTRHKYQAGVVTALAGSKSMPGAALLSTTAALRTGCGMVRLLHQEGEQASFSSAPYELVRVPYRGIDEVVGTIAQGKSVLIGPGLGLGSEVRKLLALLLSEILCPAVIDADALTIIAEEGLSLPKECVLTPHQGELERLLGTAKPEMITLEFLSQCQKYVDEKKCTLVLKGAPSFIFHPEEVPLVNGTGDPGMATAGSGDVLTGMIAAFLAQGMRTRDAAALGTYLHGIAGERAAEQQSSYCLIASDIIDFFPEAFLWV